MTRSHLLQTRCHVGTQFQSLGTTSAKQERLLPKNWHLRWPMVLPILNLRCKLDCPLMPLRHASHFSSMHILTSLKKLRSIAQHDESGRVGPKNAMAQHRSARCSYVSIRRQPEFLSQRSSQRSISYELQSRRWPGSWVAHKVCTQTQWMKPLRYQQRRRRVLRCARSKFWPTKQMSQMWQTHLAVRGLLSL